MSTFGISAVAVVLAAQFLGCAAQSPTYEKQLSELREKVLILQNQRDRLEERLAAVEQRQGAMLSQQQPERPRLTRPPLKVVVLQPEPEATPGQPHSAQTSGTTDERTSPAPSGTALARPLISGEGTQLKVTKEQP